MVTNFIKFVLTFTDLSKKPWKKLAGVKEDVEKVTRAAIRGVFANKRPKLELK